MTVSSTTAKNTFAGNGATTVFAYTFRILADAQILVQEKVDATGAITTKVITTEYTVSGAGDQSGGNVTMVTAPATGVTLILSRSVPILQETDYVENDTFPAESHEEALDELTMISQEISEKIDRAVKVDIAITGFDATIPDPTANTDEFLKYNSAGTGFETVTLSTSSGLGNIVEDTTPQLGGTLDSNSQQIRWSKGVDVASATALTLGTDGNYFDVTGTTTITSIATLAAGTVARLHFDGILTLTHSATDLVLPGGANITTAAGDEFTFVEYATGDWRCTSYALASGKAIVETETAASDTVAGAIEIAVQSEQETGTSTTLAVTPGRQQFHQSSSKGWVQFNMAASVSGSYNVASVADNAAGDFAVVWDTDFSSTGYSVVAVCDQNSSSLTQSVTVVVTNPATNLTSLLVGPVAGGSPSETNIDTVSVVAFGDQ